MKCRCTSCNGNKKIMKLGMVMGECGNCKGTGTEIKAELVAKPEPTKKIDKDVVDSGKNKKRK